MELLKLDPTRTVAELERMYNVRDRRVNRAEFVAHLRRCANDWRHISDGSFYGVPRKPDAAVLQQSAMVDAMADRVERRGMLAAELHAIEQRYEKGVDEATRARAEEIAVELFGEHIT